MSTVAEVVPRREGGKQVERIHGSDDDDVFFIDVCQQQEEEQEQEEGE